MRKKLSNLVLGFIIASGSMITLSSAGNATDDDWITGCFSSPGNNTGRCYGNEGNRECRPSINPFKTCIGTIGVGPLDPEFPE